MNLLDDANAMGWIDDLFTDAEFRSDHLLGSEAPVGVVRDAPTNLQKTSPEVNARNGSFARGDTMAALTDVGWRDAVPIACARADTSAKKASPVQRTALRDAPVIKISPWRVIHWQAQ
jgi:hypothetical protein